MKTIIKTPGSYLLIAATAVLCLIAPPSHGTTPQYNFKSFLDLMHRSHSLDRGYKHHHDSFVKSRTNYASVSELLHKLSREERHFLDYRMRLKNHHGGKMARRDKDRLNHYHSALRKAINQLSVMRRAFAHPLIDHVSGEVDRNTGHHTLPIMRSN